MPDRGVNKVTLVGSLARAPELRYTPIGKPVASLCVVTPHRWTTSDGEPRSSTEWFNVVAWRDLAEHCAQLNEGSWVYVEGRLQTRQWDDDSGHHVITEVVAHDVIALADDEPFDELPHPSE